MNSRNPNRHTQAGFTLIELLIALSIFSLMTVMAYGGLSAVIQTRANVTASMDRLAAVQKTIYRLQSDIESAQARPVRDEYGDVQAAMQRDVDGDGLYFTRGGWRNPLGQPRSAMQRVYYLLEDEKLQRHSWPMLDGSLPDRVTETTLLEDVEEVRWRFLEEPPVSGEDFADLEWQEQWPPIGKEGAEAALPRAVELVMVTKDWGEIRYLFRLSSGMNLSAVPQPGGGDGDGDDDADNAEDKDGDDTEEDEDNNNSGSDGPDADSDNDTAGRPGEGR